MARNEMSIEGIEELTKELGKIDKNTEESAKQGLIKGSLEIVAETKKVLTKNNNVYQNRLRESYSYELEKEKTGIASYVGTNVKYAPYVEMGTEPHPMNPYWLKDWVRVKGLPEGVEFAIADKIRREGTKPHPHLRPAFESKIAKVIRDLTDIIGRSID